VSECEREAARLPMPPMELRQLVGPTEDVAYDNASGERIWGDLVYGPLEPGAAYRRVFDFGCGCGRQARQLLLQKEPPGVYVGVDISRKMIEWCQQHLGRENVTFHYHDVWQPNYAPDNTRRLTLPIRQHGSDFTLINAHSVFTHLLECQTRFYLEEMRAMLAERALLRTTWFFFNRDWFPPLAPHQHCVFLDDQIPTQAVYYDWGFFVDLMHEMGFRILDAWWARTSGYQSLIWLGWGEGFEDNPAVTPPDTVLGFGYSRARHVGTGPYGSELKTTSPQEHDPAAT